jgi:hypothetical protein
MSAHSVPGIAVHELEKLSQLMASGAAVCNAASCATIELAAGLTGGVGHTTTDCNCHALHACLPCRCFELFEID